jgi:hypothetical protein
VRCRSWNGNEVFHEKPSGFVGNSTVGKLNCNNEITFDSDFFFVKVCFKILRDIFVFVRRNDQTMKGRKKLFLSKIYTIPM